MEDGEELTDQERQADKRFNEDPAESTYLAGPPDRISVKKKRIHLEASRRLAAMGGTMPELEDIPRRRADKL